MWILSIILVTCLAHVTSGQTCTSSRDCGTGYCCVDSVSGNNLVNDPQGPFEMMLGEGTNGHCVAGTAGAGEMCDDDCQCMAGYECYRRVTGACCAPRTCITQAEADADRQYWQCHPPPPRKRAADAPARRSVFYDALCPHIVPMAPAGGDVVP